MLRRYGPLGQNPGCCKLRIGEPHDLLIQSELDDLVVEPPRRADRLDKLWRHMIANRAAFPMLRVVPSLGGVGAHEGARGRNQ